MTAENKAETRQPTPPAGMCWLHRIARRCWIHQWGKWQPYKQSVRMHYADGTLVPNGNHVVKRQQRTCELCGKIQDRPIA